MTAAMTRPAATPEAMFQEAAFHALRPAAEALDERAVKIRGDAPLALDNFLTGLDNVLGRRDTLTESWPAARVEGLVLSRQSVLAAVFAASQADLADANSGALTRRTSEMYDLRDKLLSSVETAAKFGLVPAELVRKFREGQGSLDAAQDGVGLVAFFREHAAVLANKTPVTSALLDRTESLCNELVVELKSSASKARVNTAAKAAADLANRYWTLLVAAHVELRKAGSELWGDGKDAFVPLLQSRTATRHKPVAEPAPTPVV